MPKTDTFLQRLGRASLGLVEHRIAPRPKLTGDGWTPWSKHDQWALDYVDGAGMRTEISDPAAVFPRQSATWHCYAPGTTYREGYARAPHEWMWFFFTLGAALPPLTSRRFSVIADPEGRLAGYCRIMHAHQQRGGADSELVQRSLMHAALAEILSATHQGGDGSPAQPWRLCGSSDDHDESLQRRLDRLVMASLASPPSLADLAIALDMSVSNLSHRFKAESGMTVIERMRWLRIREARRLLANGASIKLVARKLGFSSASYFARVFTAITGIAPLEYQRSSTGR